MWNCRGDNAGEGVLFIGQGGMMTLMLHGCPLLGVQVFDTDSCCNVLEAVVVSYWVASDEEHDHDGHTHQGPDNADDYIWGVCRPGSHSGVLSGFVPRLFMGFRHGPFADPQHALPPREPGDAQG